MTLVKMRNKLNVFCNKLAIQNELIYSEKNNGFAVANNILITKAEQDKCEYIIILNNDTIVEKK